MSCVRVIYSLDTFRFDEADVLCRDKIRTIMNIVSNASL